MAHVLTPHRLAQSRASVWARFVPSAVRAAPFALACVAGSAWGRESHASLVWTVLVFAGWWRARSGVEAWVVMAVYQTVAARALIAGSSAYFGVPTEWGLLVVVVGALAGALPWFALWSSRGRDEPVGLALCRLGLALVTSLVPPLAAFNVSSPVIAAGAWFPGCSYGGLLGLVALACALRTSIRRKPALWSVLFAWAALRAASGALAMPSPGIVAIRTQVTPVPLEDLVAQSRHARAVIAEVARDSRFESASIAVLPENAAGLWTPASPRLWSPLCDAMAADQRFALVGATQRSADGTLTAVAMGLPSLRATYTQRVPMPFAMWRPWEGERSSFKPHWGGPGTLELGQKVGVLICWEIGAPWAVLGSVLEGAEALVGLANVAWLRSTAAGPAEQQALASWGVLFGVPTALALNE